MAFLLRRMLSSILKATQIPHTKIPIIPIIPLFGSKFFKPPFSDHNGSFKVRVRIVKSGDEEKEEEEEEDDDDVMTVETMTFDEYNRHCSKGEEITVDKIRRMLFAKNMELFSESRVFDACWRKIMRLNFLNQLRLFGSHPSLLGKQFTCLQLIVIDENRFIQEKMFVLDKIDPDDPHSAENSRHLFRAASSALLLDKDHWVFSRSLVFKPYCGMIDKALEFTSYDPIGGLDAIKDVTVGPAGDVKAYQAMAAEASWKLSEREPETPLGIRCTEIFMCIVGDYAVNDGGLNNREAVQKLLHELNTEEGILKIQGCDVACGSSKTIPENLAGLKDIHATA